MSLAHRRNRRLEPYHRPSSDGRGRGFDEGVYQTAPQLFVHPSETVNGGNLRVPQMTPTSQIREPARARDTSSQDDAATPEEVRQRLQCDFMGAANSLAAAIVELHDLSEFLTDSCFDDLRIGAMLSQFVFRETARLRDVEKHLSYALYHLVPTPLDIDFCLGCTVQKRIAEIREDHGRLAAGPLLRVQDPRAHPGDYMVASDDDAQTGPLAEGEVRGRSEHETGWVGVSEQEIKSEDEAPFHH
ncbi:hypothetical protein PFICI_05759 [Pestalotiopsis fici W106-1]|uniref:Uncharacterized protein n=1 Tax=Pestalotiopsis fici (strain W106-1 / CGMCC3.15140) TaxID=1229662 RepID=W3XCQ6_PESFW|nr:uncharacterized protein PFICI_05759 [Pestalotiopsis fici W106-1]ETS83883.1 hypothetical protein PFICI_05759 [Pestalotiopsis fici W106-1]